MSIEYPCVYWDKGKCEKFSDDKVTSWCVEGPCGDQTPSNADRIRAMNDEELAMQIAKNIPMHAWPDSVRKIYFNYDRPSKENPKKAWLEWLQKPAEGE